MILVELYLGVGPLLDVLMHGVDSQLHLLIDNGKLGYLIDLSTLLVSWWDLGRLLLFIIDHRVCLRLLYLFLGSPCSTRLLLPLFAFRRFGLDGFNHGLCG